MTTQEIILNFVIGTASNVVAGVILYCIFKKDFLQNFGSKLSKVSHIFLESFALGIGQGFGQVTGLLVRAGTKLESVQKETKSTKGPFIDGVEGGFNAVNKTLEILTAWMSRTV